MDLAKFQVKDAYLMQAFVRNTRAQMGTAWIQWTIAILMMDAMQDNQCR
jgi:hypothetical protein